MSPINIAREDLRSDATWSPNGQSPAHSPQAQIQAAQLLMGMAANPMTGLDPYELTKVLATHLLPNAKNIQLSKDDLARKLAPPAPTLGPPGLVGGQQSSGAIPPGAGPL